MDVDGTYAAALHVAQQRSSQVEQYIRDTERIIEKERKAHEERKTQHKDRYMVTCTPTCLDMNMVAMHALTCILIAWKE